MLSLRDARKIIIFGDAARGKTTLAAKLSETLGIPRYSTDDLVWKKKYSIRHDEKESIEKVKKIYEGDTWIVEGSTTYLIEPGLSSADVILHLGFQNLLKQWKSIILRNRGEDERDIFELISFLVFIGQKRFGIGYESNKTTTQKTLAPYKDKVVFLKSFKDIDTFINEELSKK